MKNEREEGRRKSRQKRGSSNEGGMAGAGKDRRRLHFCAHLLPLKESFHFKNLKEIEKKAKEA
jgi:hypothetical protein